MCCTTRHKARVPVPRGDARKILCVPKCGKSLSCGLGKMFGRKKTYESSPKTGASSTEATRSVKLADIIGDSKYKSCPAPFRNGAPKSFLSSGNTDIKNKIAAAKHPPISRIGSVEHKEVRKPDAQLEKRLFVSSGTTKFKQILKEGEEPGKIPDDVQDYERIKAECVANGTLFEDKGFPATNASLFFSEAGRVNNIVWKRASELVENPRFFVGGASRFDVNQGQLGNCWFLAAVASLTMQEQLFYQVVPKDNSFVKDYCGAFHFRFWQYGRWCDVVVDDYLPTNGKGELLYMHSEEKNEFWSALLEKAYAKLYGSYQALTGGLATEALQDFSGGIIEIIELKETNLNVFNIMEKAEARQSFMGCSVKPDAKVTEAKTQEGLVKGHAYSITRVQKVDVTLRDKPGKIPLVRIRNPWGNEFEWKGAWGDNSKEWGLVSDETKKELNLTFEDDGEFWMSVQDFQKYYDTLEICYLSPDSLLPGAPQAAPGSESAELNGVGKEITGKRWNTSYYEGSWIPGATAGGCVNFIHKEPKTYPNNPQYVVEFDEADEDGDPEKCTVLIALMQKNRRAKKKEGVGALSIGFTIYPLKDPDNLPNPLDLDFFRYNRKVADSGIFVNLREVCARIELTPGTYCIVPSSFDPNEEGEFLIRIFSESTNRLTEHAGDLGIGEVDKTVEQVSKEESETTTQAIQELFRTTAGEDLEISWFKLKNLLDTYLKKEFQFEGFSREVCRSMVASVDDDRTGKLGLDEFSELWTNILRWKTCFKIYDEDYSGNLSSFELRKALNSAGYQISNKVLAALVLRYGDDDGSISFEDFIMISVKLKCMIAVYKDKDTKGLNKAQFSLEEWVEKTIYS